MQRTNFGAVSAMTKNRVGSVLMVLACFIVAQLAVPVGARAQVQSEVESSTSGLVPPSQAYFGHKSYSGSGTFSSGPLSDDWHSSLTGQSQEGSYTYSLDYYVYLENGDSSDGDYYVIGILGASTNPASTNPGEPIEYDNDARVFFSITLDVDHYPVQSDGSPFDSGVTLISASPQTQEGGATTVADAVDQTLNIAAVDSLRRVGFQHVLGRSIQRQQLDRRLDGSEHHERNRGFLELQPRRHLLTGGQASGRCWRGEWMVDTQMRRLQKQ